MNEYAATRPDVHVLDLAAKMCPNEDCSRPARGFSADMRFDGIHYTPAGAAQVAAWLTPRLERLQRLEASTPTTVPPAPGSPDTTTTSTRLPRRLF
jgi:hypothetical protein